MSKTISIYICESDNNWVCVASRPKRPLNSIVLDPGVKELILEDAKDFLGSRAWYAERGIPFRRGYLLYGAPGSGKTSVIHSLAGELGLESKVHPRKLLMGKRDDGLTSHGAHGAKSSSCIWYLNF